MFGNDEIEHDTVSTSSLNLQPSDIVISKLKTKNTYQNLSQYKGNIFSTYIQLIIIIFLIEGYLISRLIHFKYAMNKIVNIGKTLNITKYAHYDTLENLNIGKSYWFDDKIPILNSTEDPGVVFRKKVDTFTYSNNILISRLYKMEACSSFSEDFFRRTNNDISDIVTGGVELNQNLIYRIQHGYKSIMIRLFHLLEYIAITLEPIALENGMKKKQILYLNLFEEMNNISRNIIRPWYLYIVGELMNCFSNYTNQYTLIQFSLFVAIILFLLIVYIFFWGSYEKNLEDSFEASVQLLNLLPKEIKEQIAKNIIEDEREGKD